MKKYLMIFILVPVVFGVNKLNNKTLSTKYEEIKHICKIVNKTINYNGLDYDLYLHGDYVYDSNGKELGLMITINHEDKIPSKDFYYYNYFEISNF